MRESILLFCMLFCHILDDYYLQGILASMKQKRWWKENAPDPLYKNNYIIALLEHAFSWTFMIHVPAIVYCIIFGKLPETIDFLVIFAFNWAIHATVDDLKANQKGLNLLQDQIIHIVQVIITWFAYMSYVR